MKAAKRSWELLIILLLFTSCGLSGTLESADNAVTWEEQYNLGMRYLADGNYSEAIIAFTAAIEIEPYHAETYLGRADAYARKGDSGDSIMLAQEDYKRALELDSQLADAYIGLSQIYIKQDLLEEAKQVLQNGYDITHDKALLLEMDQIPESDNSIKNKRIDFENGNYGIRYYDSSNKLERYELHNSNNEVIREDIYSYDGGKLTRKTENLGWSTIDSRFDDTERLSQSIWSMQESIMEITYTYSEDGKKVVIRVSETANGLIRRGEAVYELPKNGDYLQVNSVSRDGDSLAIKDVIEHFG